MPPLVIAIAVVVLVAVIGLIASLLRGRSTFSGYEDIAEDCRQIARSFTRSEIFRDGNDLVVSGNYGKLPTIVRFSYDENTPALNIHMKAPSTFNMSVVPKGSRATEGRVLVRTPDDMFDARFTTRSDNPTQAKMFTGGKTVMQALQKVCCSTKTFFTVTMGAIELSELTMPQPYMGRHVSDHIGMMGTLAKQLADMPGSESVRVSAMERERTSWVVKGAIAVGAVAAVVTVFAATQDFGKPKPPDPSQEARLPAGVRPADAGGMQRLEGWSVVKATEISPAASSWLRSNRQEVGGRLDADFVGSGTPTDAAYLFTNVESGKRRVVMVGHGSGYYDVEFDQLDAIARIPHDRMESQPWSAALPAPPDGDGLVILLDTSQPGSAIVVYLSNGRLMSAGVSDYQRLSLN